MGNRTHEKTIFWQTITRQLSDIFKRHASSCLIYRPCDKHSSLFCRSISYRRNMFYNLESRPSVTTTSTSTATPAPGHAPCQEFLTLSVNVIKLWSLPIILLQNKQERLSPKYLLFASSTRWASTEVVTKREVVQNKINLKLDILCNLH
jgi:hypothetical protein